MSVLPKPPPRSLAVLPLDIGPEPPGWASRAGYNVGNLVVVLDVYYRCIVAVPAAPAPAPVNPSPPNSSWVVATQGDPYFVAGTYYTPGDVVSFTDDGLVDPQFYMCLVAGADSPADAPDSWKPLSTGSPVLTVASGPGSGISVVANLGEFDVATDLTVGYGLTKGAGTGTALALGFAPEGSVGAGLGSVGASGQFVGILPIPSGVTVTANSIYLVTPLSSTTSATPAVASGWHLEWNSTPGRWEIYVDVPAAGDLTKTITFGWVLLKP